MVKIKIGTEGFLASLLNTITHFMLPWFSGFLMAYAMIENDAILLVIGAFILFPISLFDITFEEEREDA